MNLGFVCLFSWVLNSLLLKFSFLICIETWLSSFLTQFLEKQQNMLQAFAKHNKMMKDCSAGKGTYIETTMTFKKISSVENFFLTSDFGFYCRI
jgi:hypothetical protein